MSLMERRPNKKEDKKEEEVEPEEIIEPQATEASSPVVRDALKRVKKKRAKIFPLTPVRSIPKTETKRTAEEKVPRVEDLAEDLYAGLSEMEKDILEVAKSSLKKKKYPAEIEFEPYTPMVEKLYNDCLAKYHAQKGYSKEDIITSIKTLERKRWIVTAERRTKEEILESELYQDILKFLEEFPGIHARNDMIQEKLGITRNPFLKHLLVLERFELIEKQKHGKLWNFFLPEFPEDEDLRRAIVYLYNDIPRQIIKLLLTNPESKLMELAESIIPPVFHGTVQYHLKKFENIGLVLKENGSRVVNRELLERYNQSVAGELAITQ